MKDTVTDLRMEGRVSAQLNKQLSEEMSEQQQGWPASQESVVLESMSLAEEMGEEVRWQQQTSGKTLDTIPNDNIE